MLATKTKRLLRIPSSSPHMKREQSSLKATDSTAGSSVSLIGLLMSMAMTTDGPPDVRYCPTLSRGDDHLIVHERGMVQTNVGLSIEPSYQLGCCSVPWIRVVVCWTYRVLNIRRTINTPDSTGECNDGAESASVHAVLYDDRDTVNVEAHEHQILVNNICTSMV